MIRGGVDNLLKGQILKQIDCNLRDPQKIYNFINTTDEIRPELGMKVDKQIQESNKLVGTSAEDATKMCSIWSAYKYTSSKEPATYSPGSSPGQVVCDLW
jgi:hypothetical protein